VHDTYKILGVQSG